MISPLLTTLSGRIHPRSAGELSARLVAAAGLIYDAYGHLDLAAGFDANTAAVSQGLLFRVEAVLASVAALLVLISRRRSVSILVALVTASALGAVLLYRYLDVGIIGPLPNMYEPIWYPEKAFSAIAEGGALLAAGYLLLPRYRKQ
ncbi:MAG: hypothetical protein ACRDSH_02700 [Pseudonocardiaceae bacterium]